MPKLPVEAGRARPVFRPGCGPEGPKRSVDSCTWLPRLEALQRPPRRRGSGADPRTPPDRCGGSARLCRSVADAGAGCTDAGSQRLRPPARRRRRLLPAVTLQPLDGEGERPLELGEEGEARAVMQPQVEPQDPEARTVVQGSVLKRPAARDLHILDVDLDR